VTATAISDCMSHLSQWMLSHRLKLNPDKTEFLWLGTTGQLTRQSTWTGTSRIARSKHLMKLVVSVWLFSLTFNLNDMFKLSVVRHFFQLRQLRNVRHSAAWQRNSCYIDSCFCKQ